MKVWGRKTSVNVQKVMWAAAEVGLAPERVDVGGPFGGLDTPDYGALNPNRLVPTLEDGNTVVWEGHAIVRYLAATHSAGTMWPNDAGVRAKSDMWMDWVLSVVTPEHFVVFGGFVRTPADQRDMAAIAAGGERWGKAMAVFDDALGDKPFLMGDTLTIGDIAVGAMLYRYFTLPFERPSLPGLDAYYGRLTERPGYGEHVMVPWEPMKVPGA